MRMFTIYPNAFLSTQVNGYFHQWYVGFGQDHNPDFINVLKNTFGNTPQRALLEARNTTIEILIDDLSELMIVEDMPNCICMCVPRSKALNTYTELQLMFQEAVSCAARNILGATDGTGYMWRINNTYTTHLDRATQEGRLNILNGGSKPYIGITKDTCIINRNNIQNRDIILVDDIYTKNINIDEDCIQALLDNGAKRVVFYSIGYTRRNG